MENKIYLEEFLDKLTKMLETSTTKEQVSTCIKYIENYKTQLKDVIENDLFRDSTINYLDEIINTVEDGITK
jgi:hypothetical protein